MARRITLQALQGERYFRWRGGDVSRIEGITDAVIALAMTLLIVSLEVPTEFSELRASFRQMPAFLVCFLLLVMCWYYHFQFHRRFGLENLYTIFLNAAFLFLILFYVYPLKFLFTRIFDGLFQGAGVVTSRREGQEMMLLYSGGLVGIFLMLFLMHLHAWRHRDVLELNEPERLITVGTLREHLIHMSIGLASIALALAGQVALSGLIYFLVGPAQGLNGWHMGRRVVAAAGD